MTPVIPAQAGIQSRGDGEATLGSRLRGNDKRGLRRMTHPSLTGGTSTRNR